MTNERRTKLTDALVRVLCRFLTPIGVALPGAHDEYMRDSLLSLAGHGDGHVLTVAVAFAPRDPHWPPLTSALQASLALGKLVP